MKPNQRTKLQSLNDLARHEKEILNALKTNPWAELFLVDPIHALEELGWQVDPNLRRELRSRFPKALRPNPDLYARVKGGTPLVGPRVTIRIRSLSIPE